ncbi:hypothetical protein MAC_08115 [Metarhizium acridum CQMa 102]|uniref:Uncharacterized protein n=1 Tax=Metarhizium acridum (strain CQMa 102) TaxID=655827 RepID=E9EE17_METAQ|nr:uncharacterized protein MAC_08115 [Metarhizium acridum CQMa 102]EFY85856.1 hypothetical protein MAC_08115 [Metarhizium acridum CQMa 102]
MGLRLYTAQKVHRIWLLDQALVSFDIYILDGRVVFEYDGEGEEMEPESKPYVGYLDVDETANEALSADETVLCQNLRNNVQFDHDDDFSPSDGDGDVTDDDMSSATSADIMTWFRKLKDTPGSYGQWVPEYWHPDIARPLLIKHRWPNISDGDVFQLDQPRLEAIFDARNAVSRQRIEQSKWNMTERHRDQKILQARLNAATTQDYKWHARFQLLIYEQSKESVKSVTQNVKEAEDRCKREVLEHRRQGPIEGDWPLWELKKMRELLEYERSKIERLREMIKNRKNNAKDDCGPATGGLEKELAHAQRNLGIYESPVVVSQLNAERLCPGRTVDELSDPSSTAKADQLSFEYEPRLKPALGQLVTLEKWAVELPAEARRTKQKARHELKRLRKKIEGLRQCQQT